jgi:hypothetical protein
MLTVNQNATLAKEKQTLLLVDWIFESGQKEEGDLPTHIERQNRNPLRLSSFPYGFKWLPVKCSTRKSLLSPLLPLLYLKDFLGLKSYKGPLKDIRSKKS